MATLKDILDQSARPAAPELAEPLERDWVRCYACGHECRIPPGQVGVCKVRFNRAGRLYAPWGYVGGVQCDPIEKKPFFHVEPGALAYSFGMLGCDLHCAYCQNWVTSQALRDPAAVSPPLGATPEALVRDARRQGARVLVSTYNEPLITSEWAVAIFQEARAAGLKTAFVSNGNATPRGLEYLRPWIDFYKVDLKSFDDRHYRQLGGRIEPILSTIRRLQALGIWLEIVTLIIPGFNDSSDELTALAEFLAGVSPDIPWHVTAFHKDYKMTDPADTPAATLERAAALGRRAGLRYVYAGNLPGQVTSLDTGGKISSLEDTHCSGCGALLIGRYGYRITEYRLTAEGTCPDCGAAVPGRWARRFGGQIASRPFLPHWRPNSGDHAAGRRPAP